MLVLLRACAALVAGTLAAGCDRSASIVPGTDAAQPAGSAAATPVTAASAHGGKGDAKRKAALPVRVHDAAERGKMQQYVQSMVEPGAVQHSFHLPSGHDVDCVDAQKQPAMHLAAVASAPAAPPRAPPVRRKAAAIGPMVKAHPVRTAVHPPPGKDESGSDRKCPSGTVPVRRVPLEEVTAFKDLASFNHKAGPPSKRTLKAQYAFGATSKHEHAVFGAEDVTNHGAHAIFNIWSPSVEVDATGDWGEFSLAQLWVLGYGGSRPYESLQSLEAGFQVWPERYGDSEARLFVYSTSDGYQQTGCYEPCGRFVQTSRDVIIGGALPCYSSPNSEQCEVELAWWQSPDGWWLYVNDEPVGYYPAKLYAADGLRNQANTIMFGGEIVDDRSQHPGRHTRTRMGSGAYAAKGYESAAYVRDIYYYDASSNAVPASQLYAMPDAETPACYDLSPLSNDTGAWGTYFFFGGPGYGHDCP